MKQLFAIVFSIFTTQSLAQNFGQLDYTFGDSGIVKTTMEFYDIKGIDINVLPNGRSIVLATSPNLGGSGEVAIMKYNTDGGLDTSWGTEGILAGYLFEADTYNYYYASMVITS